MVVKGKAKCHMFAQEGTKTQKCTKYVLYVNNAFKTTDIERDAYKGIYAWFCFCLLLKHMYTVHVVTHSGKKKNESSPTQSAYIHMHVCRHLGRMAGVCKAAHKHVASYTMKHVTCAK